MSSSDRHHSIGTPSGGEKKQRRLGSPYPMQEMDGLDDETANDIAVADDHLRQPLFEGPDPTC